MFLLLISCPLSLINATNLLFLYIINLPWRFTQTLIHLNQRNWVWVPATSWQRDTGSAIRTKQWYVPWSRDMHSHSSGSSGKYVEHSGRSTRTMQCHGVCKQVFKEKFCFSVSVFLFSFMCLKLEVEESALGWPKDKLCVYACTEHAQPLGLLSFLFSISVN